MKPNNQTRLDKTRVTPANESNELVPHFFERRQHSPKVAYHVIDNISMSLGLSINDLIFSDRSSSQLSKTLGALKRSTLSIHNRLQSIREDALFAQQVADKYRRPLVANERCGSWYVDPQRKIGSAYFKSTDGHTAVWKFSTRRLNLHLLDTIGSRDGSVCIIVDSTRRGKRMPDALSKTIPIWCSVLNRFLFPNRPEYHELYTPPQIISPSEHEQIAALLPSFLNSFNSLLLDYDQLRGKLSKPLRPFWVTPDSELGSAPDDPLPEYHLIICCTVSRRVEGSEVAGGGYVQGAGDDTENWAHGLSPPLFWANQRALLSTPENDLPALIEDLVDGAIMRENKGVHSIRIAPTASMIITIGPCLLTDTTGPRKFNIQLNRCVTDQATWMTGSNQLEIGLGPSKKGSNNLRSALPYISACLQRALLKLASPSDDNRPQIIVEIGGESSSDHAVGIALALICLFFDDQGVMVSEPPTARKIDKCFIRQRLAWITNSMPDANPSRATLQSVNSFLMVEQPK